ncbi:sigma-70 family RNA polymerase sigma factor [Pseudoxanthomonas sp. F37]|uniref:RNA polymerase sigma factor n=1 Tax=Pseudoxanthomonas sp. F37 TaxID=2932492 RepID=UPI001FD05EFC|nr:sigma-70 family RNA polymerase sigma factor [Pseudoxanthomonas sp. F37]UOV07763.1 sigma-70 family RNA polymerase sigma factor [Pseudoxanthomonas sp. F37]
MTSPTDTDARAGFQALLQAHRGIVAKVAGTYAWHPDDRDDLMQEIATQLWRAWPGYDPQRPAATWMYRIALNVAISYVRGRTRGVQPEPFGDHHGQVADPHAHDHEARQQVDLLHRFIHAQPPLDRALLLLYLEDRSYREMADVLGLSETNVATKISRLKQRVRTEL